MKLYQFPISHYCEKVRWALDYKNLEYQKVNLLPGQHLGKTRKLSPNSSVPILVHGGNVVYESSQIITYLDKTFPQNPLTPGDESAKQSALDWERFADEEIGPHVRLLCYHVLLDHPEIVIPFFTHKGPWYGPILIRRMFPKIRVKMRAFMKINGKSADSANQRLAIAVDKVCEHRKGKDYMVGDTFTRADLAIASLLAPFCRPEKYGLGWPARYPQALENLIEPYAEKISWVDQLYKTRRP